MRFVDLLASCYLIAHAVFLCFFPLVVDATPISTKTLLLVTIASSGFLIKTVRQIFIKEVFKWYYDHRFSISKVDTLRCCFVCLFYQFSLFSLVLVLNKVTLSYLFHISDFNQFSRGNIAFCALLFIEILALNFSIYKFILKKHFESNVNKYALLYWHCRQIFEKHNVPNNLHISKVRCVWKRINTHKIPWMYFENIYREFVSQTLLLIGIIYTLTQVDSEKYPAKYITDAMRRVVGILKHIYCYFSNYKFIINVLIFMLSIILFAFYLKKVLQWTITDTNKLIVNKIRTPLIKRMSRIYIKTKQKNNTHISYYYALKWSTCIISGIWLLVLLNKFVANSNTAIFINMIYSTIYLIILYFTLHNYVTKYSIVYKKIFICDNKRYEFCISTDNWGL